MVTSAEERLNVLFICSRNQWRSPTGERIYMRDDRASVRSAGTSPSARKTIKIDDISWADIICVMEEKHKNRIKAGFPRAAQFAEFHVLDIPDDYAFMDPELVEMLTISVEAILKERQNPVAPEFRTLL